MPPPAALRRRHRTLERRGLDLAVAHRPRRRGAARRPRRGVRGGRVGGGARRRGRGGAVGRWGAGGWPSPWRPGPAGAVLLDARDAGFAVSDSVVGGLAEYVRD